MSMAFLLIDDETSEPVQPTSVCLYNLDSSDQSLRPELVAATDQNGAA